MVRLEMNGSTRTVELETLSEKDQAYLQDWYSAYSLMSKKRLRVIIEENKDDEICHERHNGLLPNLNQGKKWVHHRHICKSVNYDIILNNKSRSDLTDIIIEYCIYHRGEVSKEVEFSGKWIASESIDDGGGAQITGRKKLPKRMAIDTITGQVVIATLPKKNEFAIKTEKMILAESGKQTQGIPLRPGTWSSREIDCDLLGIHCRIYLPTPNGNYAMMEFSDPEDLLKEREWLSLK